MRKINFYFLITSFLILFFACQQEEESFRQSEGEGIEIEGAWARPGSEGGTSAAYFLITNFEDEADTLRSVQSDVAQLVEVHESYQQDNHMVGMREADEVVIPANTTVKFEQGGLHVMLMQLNQNLSDGNAFELKLNFVKNGNISLEIPVKK